MDKRASAAPTAKILIIDDDEIARITLESLLSINDGQAGPRFELHFAENGHKGIALAEALLPDIILLDVMMPDLNGFDTCKLIRSNPLLAEAPILFITALDDRQSRMAGLRAGADDFITKPFDAFELLIRVQNMARLNRYRLLTEQRQELMHLHEELMVAYDKTIEGWSTAMDIRDQETGHHSRSIAQDAVRLARAAGFSEEELRHVWRGSLLHDVGKLGIPDRILQKPGPLTDEEWVIMRLHPAYAFEMLSAIHYLGPALDIPYCHHEKWDGSGYPRGLKGEEIPYVARLFAVVDVWNALTSDRVYRKQMSVEQAVDIIKGQSGRQFDPQVVELFLKVFFGPDEAGG